MICKGILSSKCVSVAFLLLLAAGCRTEADLETITGGDSDSKSGLSVFLPYSVITDTDSIESIIDDISFYAFDLSKCYDRTLAMTRSDQDGKVTYTGTLETGTWNVVIATESDKLTNPNYMDVMSEVPMYTMTTDLTSCPEIFYGRLDDVEIQAGVTAEESATLARNVSKVFVRLTDRNGMVDESEDVIVRLKEVPSTISWAGTILNNNSTTQSTPTVDLNSVTLSSWEDDGTYPYVEQEFIIPAHRGTDFGDDNPSDTLVHKMSIYVSYTDKATGKEVAKEKEVPKVPLCNGQIRYNLIPSGTDVSIEVTLLDWEVEETQEETVSEALSFSCYVIPRDGVCEIPIENVYKSYAQDGNPMSQTETVVPLIVENNNGNAVESVEMVNRAGSWPHAVLKVSSSAVNEGDAVVGIRLNSDNDNYIRWKWHIIVSDTQSQCNESNHTNGMPQ